MRTAIVLPVKAFGRAKTRISPALADPDRALLAEAMVGDVLAALSVLDNDLLVVTAEPRAADLAREAGATVVRDTAEAGHVSAALVGCEAAIKRGAERVLFVPGDCPAVDPTAIVNLLASRAQPPGRRSPNQNAHGLARDEPSGSGRASIDPGANREVVVVPDRHGTGTNALLLSPPDVMVPSFGAGSFARHSALARSAGALVRVVELPSLALDVDAPEDLEPLAAWLAERPEAAPRTRAALERLALLGVA